MRYFRRLVVALFVVSLALYVGVRYWEYRNTDTEGPELVSEVEELELSVSDGEEALLSGLTATDAKDGDLTDAILVRGTSFFIEPGELTVDYVVFDSDGNSGSLSRKVRYTDYTSPEFSVGGSLYFVRGTSSDILDSVQATDVLEGDISAQVELVSGDVDVDTAGQYPITVGVTNSYGDRAEADAYVIIGESWLQTGVILTDTFVYLDSGDSFAPEDYIRSYVVSSYEELEVDGMNVYQDGEFFCSVSTSGTVDTSASGCYLVEYSWDSGSVWLSVIVRE